MNVRSRAVASWGLVFLVAIGGGIGATARGQDGPAPKHIDITLPKEYLVGLPQAVRNVAACPDGRAWYLVWSKGEPPIDALQDNIEQQWDQPAPQVMALPLLFEPGADGKLVRAWFRLSETDGKRPLTVLSSYDGKRWTEWKPPVDFGAIHAVASGGKVFFGGWGQVAIFDGTAWTTKDFRPGPRSYLETVRLVPEPDGRGMLAVVDLSPDSQALWRWREGTWTKLAVGKADEWISIRGVAPLASGAWVFYYAQPASTIRPHRGGPVIKDANGVVINGGGPEPAGNLSLMFLDYQAESPGSATRAGLAKPGVCQVGDFALADPTGFHRTADGRAFVAGRLASQGAERGQPVVLMMEPGGRWSKLLTGRAASHWPVGQNYTQEFESVLTTVDGGKKIWRAVPMQAPVLVDLARQEVTPVLSWVRNPQLVAVLKDGRAFIRGEDGTVVAVDPAAPDNRVPLKLSAPRKCVSAVGEGGVLDIEGRYWSSTGETVERFDGTRWTSVPAGKTFKDAGLIVPGRKDMALVSSRDRWTLVTPGKTVDNANLEDLIAANAKTVAEGFSGWEPAQTARGWTCVHADRNGNIWVMQVITYADYIPPPVCKVYVKDHWIDVIKMLRKDDPTQEVRGMLPLADGERTLLANWSTKTRINNTVLASIDDKGELNLRELSGLDTGTGGGGHYDATGTLWTPNYARNRGVVGISPKGELTPIPGHDFRCVDDAGNLWLRPWSKGGLFVERMVVWNQGQTYPAPRFFGGAAINLHMLSDKDSSFWAQTHLGLVHLISDGGPGRFKVENTYRLDTGFADQRHIVVSKLGFMALETWSPKTGWAVQTAPLPR